MNMNFWQLLLTAVLGAIGWWITNFFLEPLRRFGELRRRAQLEMFTVHHGRSLREEDREIAKERQKAFLQIGYELLAFHRTAPVWIHWWLSAQSYDAGNGAAAFMRIANSPWTGPKSITDLGLSSAREEAARCLKLDKYAH